MPRIPLALEMYSVRKEFAASPLAVMHAVKEMGYEGVEFAGDPQYCPEFYAALLKESDLVCCGWHTRWELLQLDSFKETVKLNQCVGNKYVIITDLRAEGHKGWQQLAQEVNMVADKLAAYGMRCGYHCHAGDFKLIEGKTTWDTFFANTYKKVVMQLDTGNALAGNANLMQILHDNPGRCQTIHLKPYSFVENKKYDTMIGEDDTPWGEVLQFCKSQGDTEWAIVEYESPSRPAMEAVKQCIEGLRKLGW